MSIPAIAAIVSPRRPRIGEALLAGFEGLVPGRDVEVFVRFAIAREAGSVTLEVAAPAVRPMHEVRGEVLVQHCANVGVLRELAGNLLDEVEGAHRYLSHRKPGGSRTDPCSDCQVSLMHGAPDRNCF
jgi:hypothetical protein